jgi:hypothetical protein
MMVHMAAFCLGECVWIAVLCFADGEWRRFWGMGSSIGTEETAASSSKKCD